MSKDNNDFTPPCDKCGGQCCRYVAIGMDRPRTKTDYDHIRWYLSHENVNVFIDHDRGWYVEFRSPCENLMDDGRCAIYEIRPAICRSHGNLEEECEFFDSPYREYFRTRLEFEKYLKKRGIDWRFKYRR